MKRREFIAAGLMSLTVAPVAFTGCGGGQKSPRGVVKFAGTATFGGEPIPEGFMITFMPTGGRPSAALVEAGGKFYARYTSAEDGVEHGALKVTINWDDEANNGADVPEGFADLVKNYGTQDNALQITVEKADTSYALDFPKK